jgi:TerB-like protein
MRYLQLLMELLLWAALVGGIWLAFRLRRLSNESHPVTGKTGNSRAATEAPSNIRANTALDSPRHERHSSDAKSTARSYWVPKGEGIEVQGISISGGLLYFGSSLNAVGGYGVEPALIDPRLPVQMQGPVEDMPYWPSYSQVGGSDSPQSSEVLDRDRQCRACGICLPYHPIHPLNASESLIVGMSGSRRVSSTVTVSSTQGCDVRFLTIRDDSTSGSTHIARSGFGATLPSSGRLDDRDSGKTRPCCRRPRRDVTAGPACPGNDTSRTKRPVETTFRQFGRAGVRRAFHKRFDINT